jgi:hypothetical protein
MMTVLPSDTSRPHRQPLNLALALPLGAAASLVVVAAAVFAMLTECAPNWQPGGSEEGGWWRHFVCGANAVQVTLAWLILLLCAFVGILAFFTARLWTSTRELVQEQAMAS